MVLYSEKATFIVAIILFVFSMIYAFLVWINNNDIAFQGMCGFISTILFIAGIQNALMTPNWHIYAHTANKIAIFLTNWIASFSALSFSWSIIIEIIIGRASARLLTSQRHEGFVYVCANMFLSFGFSIYTGFMEYDTLIEMRNSILKNSWFYILIGTIYNTLLDFLIGYRRINLPKVMNDDTSNSIIET
ncbi:hypothetical protein TRFO_11018 [Tritrichomonas foetus]|uniref:Uncharacterized protein n=1 Tax=Tritrichomonas foetus TaxID=1144522 RepID=A0A1J4J8Q9_9EUKA|nr:hypothetical protein TRFO_11018 [Tritrichomonas foetus]|eukprot:OHS94631.1 hypothetical protein TRFO_11018 [Tritrichomonas foetus]